MSSSSHHRRRRTDGTPVTLPLATRAPFHLEATVRVLQRRPANVVDVWVHDRYRRILMTPGGLALVEVSNEGTIEKPNVRVRILRGKGSVDVDAAVVYSLRRMLGLDIDPRPLQRLVEAEPRLHHIAVALRGMRSPRFATLFEAFASVVPFQQVSLDAGVAIVSRLVERFGESVEHDGHRIHAFPAASTIADGRLSALRACGVSARKGETLQNVARAIASGQVTEEKLARMDSRDASRVLTELPGIGPWSADLILLRGMGRLDVFPPGDVGVARGLSELLHLPAGRSLARTIERFGEHRGYLYFCSLGGALLARGLIRAAPPRDINDAGGRNE